MADALILAPHLLRTHLVCYPHHHTLVADIMGDIAATQSYPPPSASPVTGGLARTKSPAAISPQPSNRANLIREIACHVNLIIAGWGDASSGPLIPYIQAYYGLSYEVVSLLFVGAMVGSVAGALSNGHLAVQFGMGRVITIGAVIQGVGYCFLIPAFNFPSFPVVYGVVGSVLCRLAPSRGGPGGVADTRPPFARRAQH